jgi:hypothetical protein
MKVQVALAASVCLGAVVTQADAGPVVDQSNTPMAWTILQVNAHTPMGQEFVPSHTAVGFADIYLEDAFSNVGNGSDFQIRVHNDTIGGTILGTSQVVRAPDSTTAAGAYQRFNFATPVAVIPGNRYVLETVLVSPASGDALGFGMGAGQLNTYLSGRPIVNGSATTRTNDFLFRSGRSTNTGPAASGTFGAFGYRGVIDSNKDGIGDTLSTFGAYVARNDAPTGNQDEVRPVFEYDVARFADGVASATISGELFRNNSLDTGPRTVRLELFDGDGVISVADYSVAATPAGTFTFHPPADVSVPFEIDITAQLNTLLAGGADFLGARFTPANQQAPSGFSDVNNTPVLNIVVPEPGSIGLVALALGAGLLRRRRDRAA